jgi:hypothetical protein
MSRRRLSKIAHVERCVVAASGLVDASLRPFPFMQQIERI